tara:strand:+ start:690 stop:1166 length:477 start_codon:yes stop_codon:yes gene_type:complete
MKIKEYKYKNYTIEKHIGGWAGKQNEKTYIIRSPEGAVTQSEYTNNGTECDSLSWAKSKVNWDIEEKKDFVSYCLKFYGKNEIYDIEATKEEVEKALEVRLTDKEGILKEFSKPLSEIDFDGDSVDREMVRDIVLTLRGEQPWETIFEPVPFSEREQK